MLSGCDIFARLVFQLFPQIKSAETVVKFCSCKFHRSHLLYRYTLREGLGTAKLLMDVARIDIIVNIKGGATCSNSKQLLSSFYMSYS